MDGNATPNTRLIIGLGLAGLLCLLPLMVDTRPVSEAHYGAWSLLPAVIAIATALITHRVLPSLFLGILAGSLVLTHGEVIPAVTGALEGRLWGAISDANHVRMYVFTLTMGGLVGAMTVSGAMAGLVKLFQPLAKTRCGAQVVSCVMGVIIFFDDYANTLILGSTMRPVTDRHRISREKLSFIVDATASTVASIALVSTWCALEISLIDDALDSSGLAADGAVVFFGSIPFRFYVVFMLVFTFLIAATGRDFGPMLKAERLALSLDNKADDQTAENGGETAPWFHAALPIAVIVGVFLWLLHHTGSASLDETEATKRTLTDIIGNGDSYLALVYGSLAGLLVAIVLTRIRNVIPAEELKAAVQSGCASMIPALLILTFAWALSDVIAQLGAGKFVAGFAQDAGAGEVLIPTLVFLFSAVIAFATGTSFGTMGIVIPIAVPLAITGDPESTTATTPLLLASVGSVLAGAVFGDHCSPISDTTVLSSQASGCDHIAHVRTQLPYALAVAGVAVLCGTLPAGLGVPVWLLVIIGLAAVAALVRFAGKPVSAEK